MLNSAIQDFEPVLDFETPKPSTYLNLAKALDLLQPTSAVSLEERENIAVARRLIIQTMTSYEARLVQGVS